MYPGEPSCSNDTAQTRESFRGGGPLNPTPFYCPTNGEKCGYAPGYHQRPLDNHKTEPFESLANERTISCTAATGSIQPSIVYSPEVKKHWGAEKQKQNPLPQAR